MTLTLQLLADGIALGALLAVVALGLALVFGVMGVVNFLHAEFVTVGGYLTYFLVSRVGANPLAGLALAIIAGMAVGFLLQTTIVRRVSDRPPLDGLLLTYGLSVVGLGLITYSFSGDYRSYATGFGGGFDVAGVRIAWQNVVVILICLTLLVCLGTLLRRTRIGRAMRATAQHRDAAAVCGVNLAVVDGIAFAIGGGLGAAAGATLSMSFVTTPELGHQWLLIGFVVVVLGGLGSLTGVIFAGLGVGVAQVMLGYALDDSWAQLLIYALLFVLLLVRPGGLAGRAEAA
jgi:branched-chain amino acid transport system permease protein